VLASGSYLAVIRQRVETAAGPDWALLRLNLGDGFLILVTHAERHHGQIDRALAAAGAEGARPVRADRARTARRT
jgi:hypothetical protein